MSKDDIDEQGKVDAAAAAEAARVGREAAAQAADDAAGTATQAVRVAIDQAFYTALLDTGKGSVDRARSAAELVQKAAAAVGTLYTGVLGLTFSVSGRQLSIQGVIPALFLGLAIALSTAYIAFITDPSDVTLEPLSSLPPERMKARVTTFLTITNNLIERRAYALRAAVVALGVGVAAMPAPFINFGATVPTSIGQHSVFAVATPAGLPDWPSPPAAATDGAATLSSILYRAQVDEVANNRKRVLATAVESSAKTDYRVWVVLAIGLLAVFGAPLVGRLRDANRIDALVRWIKGR